MVSTASFLGCNLIGLMPAIPLLNHRQYVSSNTQIHMKKIIAIAIFISFFSCTPYQRIFLSPTIRHTVLEDSCDVIVITRLKQLLDTIPYDSTIIQYHLFENLINDSECEYYAYKLIPPHPNDSAVWLTTIRPAIIGKNEIILGNIYTFDPNQDSTFIFKRRIKEYSQKTDFESGKYVIFTYFIENDSTTIVKLGTRKF